MITVTTNNKDLKKFEGTYSNNTEIEMIVEADKAHYTWSYDFTIEDDISIMRVEIVNVINGQLVIEFSDIMILKGIEEF